ncbi:MAG: redoxin domain-containing protein, partial [Armatimonadota bacterium]|nr:redoxin domain-containing protein [Armatimonadota bacterium]
LGLAALGIFTLGIGGPAPRANSAEGKSDTESQSKPAAPTAPLEVGTTAPDFALSDQNNKVHKLSDYKGKTVVLAFYPKDMTKGCTLEAHSLTKALNEFEKRGVQVFGVSVQDVASKKQFCDKENITYPLLADTEKTVSRAYGVLNDRGVSNRVTFVVGPEGTITAVDRSVNVGQHAQDLLTLLDELKNKSEKKEVKEAAKSEPPPKVAIDQPVAPFTLSNYDGTAVTVGDWGDKDNKATVVIFMSTRCPVSNGYNERMADLARTFSEKGVRFIGVNANKEESPEIIAEHAKQQGFSFPVLKDSDNAIADRFDAKVTPEAYVIDAKGNLSYHGRIDDNKNADEVKNRDLRAAIEAVVAGQPVPVKETTAFGCGIKRVKRRQ